MAAQDTVNVLKQGYLEKKRKGRGTRGSMDGSLLLMSPFYNGGGDGDTLLSPEHSFFGPEWQKRWCVLNNLIFYYFGSDKGLCQPEKLQVLQLNLIRSSVLNCPGR